MVSKESECVYQMCKDSPHHPISYAGVPKSSWLERPRTTIRCKASVKKFERSPTVLAEWIGLKETLAKFQAEWGNETSDDKGSDDMTSKAERKRKSDASPVEFCCRSLAGNNVWDARKRVTSTILPNSPIFAAKSTNSLSLLLLGSSLLNIRTPG